MEKPNILSDNEIHVFGINIVLDDIRKTGFTVVSVTTEFSNNPQIVANKNGKLVYIFVRTDCYPNKGRLETNEQPANILLDAQKQGILCYFASIGIANANGTSDLEMSIPTRGAGYYISYAGLEELTLNKLHSQNSSQLIKTYNQNGQVSGEVTKLTDGRQVIKAKKMLILVHCLCPYA